MSSKPVLPNEIWTEIFKCCEADSLAADLPLVCKLFVNLTNTNELWQTKCIQRRLDLSLKKPKESFKAFYFFQHLPFFPLFGRIEIGHTTDKELIAMEGATHDANSRYATVKKVNFWYNNGDSKFKMMYLVKNIYILPKQWEDFGISYDHSWNSLLIYLREYNHNYQIKTKPCQQPFQDRPCFTATVQTVGKHKNTYFTVLFTFSYSVGNEDTKGTLYSISVNAADDKEAQRCYDKDLIIDSGYKIQNEEAVRERLAKFLERNAPRLGRKMRMVRAKPTIIPQVAVNGVHIPNEIWSLIFDFTDDQTLGVNVPQVCKSFSKLSCDERLWEQKCLKSGRDMKGRIEDEPWKRYYFLKVLALFPLFGCIIDQTTEAELLARGDGTKGAQDRYVTINGVNFWFNNADNLFKMMYIVRGIYPIPVEWIDLGITFEKSYADYLEYFKSRFGNYQVTNAPTQKFHSFMQQGSFDATVNVIGRYQNTYFLITFTFGFTPGNTRSKNTLYSISLRGSYNSSEVNEWRMSFEDRLIDHKDPIEDPDESPVNPTYGENNDPNDPIIEDDADPVIPYGENNNNSVYDAMEDEDRVGFGDLF